MIHPQKLGYPTFRPKNCNSVSCVNNWLHPNSARSSLSLSFLSVQARIWWDGGTENSESPTVLDEKLMDIIYFSNYLGQPRVPWRNWYRTNRHPGQEQHTRSDWKSSKMVVFKYETPKRIPWDHLGYPLALRSPPLVFTCFHTLEGYCSHCRFSKNLMLRLSRDWFPSVPSHRIPRHSARWSASLSAESCQMRRERRNPWWPILGSTSRPSLLGSPGGCFLWCCWCWWLVGGFKHFFHFSIIINIWDVILPIDELIFFKMVIAPPTRWCWARLSPTSIPKVCGSDWGHWFDGYDLGNRSGAQGLFFFCVFPGGWSCTV